MNKLDVCDGLDFLFPNPVCELEYSKDYELLLSVMLSAQTTDKRVNICTRKLYSENKTLEKLNKLSLDDIECYIKSIGLYKNKANNFKKIVSILNSQEYNLNDRDFLESLPGVGRKTASVVLSTLYNEPNIAVDTHVYRVSKRLGITGINDDVLKTETKLKRFFDKQEYSRISSQLVLFGRYVCKAVKPECDKCPFKGKCNLK